MNHDGEAPSSDIHIYIPFGHGHIFFAIVFLTQNFTNAYVLFKEHIKQSIKIVRMKCKPMNL